MVTGLAIYMGKGVLIMEKINMIVCALYDATAQIATDSNGVKHRVCCGGDIEFDHLPDCGAMVALNAACDLRNELYAKEMEQPTPNQSGTISIKDNREPWYKYATDAQILGEAKLRGLFDGDVKVEAKSEPSDYLAEAWREIKQRTKERKDALGMTCPDCTVRLPKAHPKILMPNQRCWCGYIDRRERP